VAREWPWRLAAVILAALAVWALVEARRITQRAAAPDVPALVPVPRR
jgi:hypothetical protein